MKILHITPAIDKIYSGPADAAINMVDFLNREVCSVDFLSTCSNNSKFDMIDFFRIKEKTKLLPRTQVFFKHYVPSLKKWLMENLSNYDLVHVHTFFNYMSHVSMTCARLKEIPYVLTPHGMLSEYHLNEKKKYLKKFWINFVDNENLNSLSSFHSTSTLEALGIKKLFSFVNVESIPLGAPLPLVPDRTEIKDRNLNLLFISRLNKKKNIPAILEAFSKACRKGISLKLKIAGEPDPGEEGYKKFLKKMTLDLNIQGQVEFCGFLSGQAKEEAFKWADIFILPSFYENFGVAVFEALSYSVPVIISPQVALSKEVREFGGGWITDENNPQSPDSVLKILELINQNKNLILEESKKARLVAERFSWENNSRALISLYKSILDKK